MSTTLIDSINLAEPTASRDQEIIYMEIAAIDEEIREWSKRLEEAETQKKVLVQVRERLIKICGIPSGMAAFTAPDSKTIRSLVSEFYTAIEGEFTTEQVFQFVKSHVGPVKRDRILNLLFYEKRRGLIDGLGEGVYRHPSLKNTSQSPSNE